MVLSSALEEFVKAYAESVHDQWSYAKVNENRPRDISVIKFKTYSFYFKIFIFEQKNTKSITISFY